jgi:hypothetical protein
MAESTHVQSQSIHDASAGPRAEVIFSLSDGIVWAGWPGKSAAIRLGKHQAVAAMMQDFLDQCALGERLVMRRPGNG